VTSVGSAEPDQATVNSSAKAVAASVGPAVAVGRTGVGVTASSAAAGVAVANEIVEDGNGSVSVAAAGKVDVGSEVIVSGVPEPLHAARKTPVQIIIKPIFRFIFYGTRAEL
jgi:hypothetical protein